MKQTISLRLLAVRAIAKSQKKSCTMKCQICGNSNDFTCDSCSKSLEMLEHQFLIFASIYLKDILDKRADWIKRTLKEKKSSLSSENVHKKVLETFYAHKSEEIFLSENWLKEFGIQCLLDNFHTNNPIPKVSIQSNNWNRKWSPKIKSPVKKTGKCGYLIKAQKDPVYIVIYRLITVILTELHGIEKAANMMEQIALEKSKKR